MPEWFKGPDLRSGGIIPAWVRTPPLVTIVFDDAIMSIDSKTLSILKGFHKLKFLFASKMLIILVHQLTMAIDSLKQNKIWVDMNDFEFSNRVTIEKRRSVE